MQSLSLAGLSFLAQAGPAAGAPDLTSALRDLASRLGPEWKTLALYLVLSQVIAIVSYWIASRPVTEDDDGTLGKAIKVWFLYTLFSVAWIFVSLWVGVKYLAPLFRTPPSPVTQEMGIGLGIIALASLVMLIAIFAVPMKVHRIGFGGALAFVILSIILGAVGGLGLQFAFRGALGRANQQVAEWLGTIGTTGPEQGIYTRKAAFVKAVQPLTKKVTDRSRPVAERQQAVKDLYAQLEAYRATLDASNPVGVAEYEKQKAIYEKALADLKAEVAAGAR